MWRLQSFCWLPPLGSSCSCHPYSLLVPSLLPPFDTPGCKAFRGLPPMCMSQAASRRPQLLLSTHASLLSLFQPLLPACSQPMLPAFTAVRTVNLASEPGIPYYLTRQQSTFQAAINYCDSAFAGATLAINPTATAKEELRVAWNSFFGSRQHIWISYQIEVGELCGCVAGVAVWLCGWCAALRLLHTGCLAATRSPAGVAGPAPAQRASC